MVEVSAGIIISDSKILCFQKGGAKYPYLSNKWEFPGGKVEKGEDPKDTLVRELSEELCINIQKEALIHLCNTQYSYPDFDVILHSYIIDVDKIKFTLTEHISYKWCTLKDLNNLDWAEADKDIVKHLEEYYG